MFSQEFLDKVGEIEANAQVAEIFAANERASKVAGLLAELCKAIREEQERNATD